MTDTIEPHFGYETLKCQDSIRLIELFPGQRGTPLSCKLREVRRRDNPTYEAVSYAWGAPPVCRYIRDLDSNANIHITDNLFDGLQAIRLRDRSRTIWVDTMSIDQTKSEEKIHQIAQMGAIYRDAIKVLVWLGRMGASKTIERFVAIGLSSRISNITSLNQIATSMHDPDSYGQEGFELSNEDPESAFFQQAWFDRVWVVQEFVLARELEIYAGSCSFSYELFSETVRGASFWVDITENVVLPGINQDQELHAKKTLAQELYTVVTLVQDLIRIREQRQVANLGGGSLPTLYQCCYSSRKRKCSIIHDQLYGVLGLAGNDLSIKVDYTCPLTRLWLDLILRSLEGGDLLPLHHAGISQGSGVDTHMTQSFIPPFEALGYKSGPLAGKPAFCASHGTAAKVEVIELGLVKIRGITIDTVANVAFHTKEPKFSIEWFDINQMEYQTNLRLPSPYGNESNSEVYSRTIAAGFVILSGYMGQVTGLKIESYASIRQNMYCRVIFYTRKGYMGLGPYGMQEGDEVIIFDGADTPFVLRADESGHDRCKLVGECYLDGWM